jgi:hypothetical protein
LERSITILSGLTPEELAALAEAGIVSGDDLSFITFIDIGEILGEASVVKRRKLSMIANYLARGQTLSDATMMPTIVDYLNTLIAASHPHPVPAPLPPQVPQPVPPLSQDPNRGAPKLYPNSIEKFSGSPMDFEDWEKKTRALLGQTAYDTFMTDPPPEGDLVAGKRNRELFNMFMTAIMDGSGLHIINGITDQDGHVAWNAITEWYGLASTSRTIIDHYRNKLESLRLDGSTEASAYVNTFIICSQKLEDKSEGYTSLTKRQKFLDQITDEEYDVSKQWLAGDETKTFHDCVKKIRS